MNKRIYCQHNIKYCPRYNEGHCKNNIFLKNGNEIECKYSLNKFEMSLIKLGLNYSRKGETYIPRFLT